ncbi:MAG: hypothetical protein LBH90_09920, partial [Tannerella sp.]|nr:hypothetical protein [Tannerella sp.]
PRKGLKRKARTTTAGRRRTCSGKPDRRVERGLRPNVLTGILPFAVLCALDLMNNDALFQPESGHLTSPVPSVPTTGVVASRQRAL